MRQDEVLRLPSMPAAGPSYPAGPYRFIDREFLVITYETDPNRAVCSLDAVRSRATASAPNR